MTEIPKKQRKALSYDVRVEKARLNLEKVNERHVRENNKDSHLEFEQMSKDRLDEVYDNANKDYLEKKPKEFDEAHINQRHRLAWKLINEVSGRKMSKCSRLKGNTKEERLDNWHDHFQNLLGDLSRFSMRMRISQTRLRNYLYESILLILPNILKLKGRLKKIRVMAKMSFHQK
jgi:hypothetical protein